MSKVVKLNLNITNLDLLLQAAAAQQLTVEQNVTVDFFSGTVHGWAIHLPGWHYPVVVDANGQLHYDNYEGHWGDAAQLTALVQAYSREVVLDTMRQQGIEYPLYTEEEEPDGTLVLTVTVGGGW